ncbi:helix-turn-helix domain-containing protein [Oscillospiraceae bacterium LTW-04]|nr:helix-turn-helix transcriptional regulator [Oscillospiraceae bacterium MB24-C1]
MLIFDRLERLVEDKGISKAFIASKLGKSRSLLIDWKKQKSQPTQEDLIVVADILSTTVEYLTGQTDIKEKPISNTGDELSTLDKQLMNAMLGLSDDQKRFLLAQIEVTLKQEQ